MGAACGCMKKNEKGESVNRAGFVVNQGGTRLGGGGDGGDVAAMRAERFGQKREE